MSLRGVALGLACLAVLAVACQAAAPVVPTSEPSGAPTSTPGPQSLYVGNTGGIGVYLRKTTSLRDVLDAWCDGTPMIIIGPDGEGEGMTWKNVRDPRGTAGWVPDQYLYSLGDLTPTPTVQCPTPMPTGQPVPNDRAALLAASSEVVSLGAAQPTPLPLATNQSRVLSTGDAVRVDDRGIGLLRFSDSLVVRIFRSSNLKIEGLVADGADVYHSLALQGGTVFNTETLQDKASNRVRVTTDTAVIDATGTKFLVYFNAQSGTSWVVVRDGAVRVRAPGQVVSQGVTVGAGFQSWVLRGQTPAPAVPADRAQIPGNLNLPSISVLTNGELADGNPLAVPVATSPTATPSPSVTPSATPSATPTVTVTPPILIRGIPERLAATPTPTPVPSLF